MKNKKRIKRWMPNASFMDTAVKIPALVLCGLLFMVGQDVVFGIGGGELHTIPFPKVPIVGWMCVYLALEQLLPPIIRRRISLSRVLVGAVRQLKTYIKGTDDIKGRLVSIEKEGNNKYLR